ncbi:hypothetical protein [Paenibacillus hamazuiensis]|uniref:hypothetical protein n=1 Tax=Paenibacillus hamazuiensis TaxID=2936508 RepID=UPI00200C3CED|nr:hypothetical protein [Paenibacillus hamazuiensis]
MSLKSIEMQFVLHKNDEVGQMQNQLSHKPVHDQAALADQAVKQTEKERQVSAKLSETSGSTIHEGLPHDSARKSRTGVKGSKRKDGQAADKETGKHPFKGHYIDLSL